jgi:hypothetical protein
MMARDRIVMDVILRVVVRRPVAPEG